MPTAVPTTVHEAISPTKGASEAQEEMPEVEQAQEKKVPSGGLSGVDQEVIETFRDAE